MESTKLYQTLSEFDAYQLNRLSKFVHSPYFNVNQKISKLYNILHAHFKHQEDLPTKEEIYTVCDAEAIQFEDRKYRKLVSDLLKLVEHFLVVDALQKNPLHQANYLLEAVYDQRLEKLYNKAVKTARRLSKRQPFRSANSHFHQYQIEKHYYNITEAEINRSERSNIDVIIRNLDNFYLIEKLKYSCTLLSRKKIKDHEYDILFIDEILKHIEKNNYEHHPEILVFYHVFKIYKDANNTNDYLTLKGLVKTNYNLFDNSDLKDIYLALINFCIGKVNKGDNSFISELNEVYNDALETKAILTDNILSPWSFKNIVLVGLRNGNYSWVESFINDYSKYLVEEHRENAIKFNTARLFYYRKEFDKVIPLLNEVEFTDFSYSLGAKAILLASFFELGEYDLLDSFLESFNKYLKRHRSHLPDAHFNMYTNLIKYTKKISHVLPGDKKAIDKLEKEISENVNVRADYLWLTAKLKELYR